MYTTRTTTSPLFWWITESDFLQEHSVSLNESESSIFEESSTWTEQFSQEVLSDIFRDLNLSKKVSKALASRLKKMP